MNWNLNSKNIEKIPNYQLLNRNLNNNSNKTKVICVFKQKIFENDILSNKDLPKRKLNFENDDLLLNKINLERENAFKYTLEYFEEDEYTNKNDRRLSNLFFEEDTDLENQTYQFKKRTFNETSYFQNSKKLKYF